MLLDVVSNLSIYQGDCVKGMQDHVESSTVDVVVTSPPYNLGIKYNSYKDSKSKDEYLSWCEIWSYEISRCMKDEGSLFLNIGAASSNPFFPFDVARTVSKYLELQNTIHWIKSISIPGEKEGEVISRGHFKPINSKRYINDCHEYVFHFTKKGNTKLDRTAIGVPYADKSNIGRWGHTEGKDKRCRGNTWFIPYKTINRRAADRPHPATFPTELAKKCVLLHGEHDCTVLDPFLGIGHAALGANESGIVSKFIGFELDPEYVKVACSELGCEPREV